MFISLDFSRLTQYQSILSQELTVLDEMTDNLKSKYQETMAYSTDACEFYLQQLAFVESEIRLVQQKKVFLECVVNCFFEANQELEKKIEELSYHTRKRI